MTSSYYTSIKNTVVSGSVLQSNLSAAQLEELLLDVALAPNATLTMLNSNLNDLSYDNWVTALTSVGGMGINSAAITAARSLNIFSDAVDTDAFAASVIQMFNLSSAAAPVVAKFRVSGVDNPAFAVNLANKTATNARVMMLPNGGAASFAAPMFQASKPAGTASHVEIYATNFTTSTRIVVFNVCTGAAT